MTIHFTKPSLRRAIWCTIIVFVVSSLATGIAVAVGFITGNESTTPVAVGDYVRLVVAALTMWGPMYLFAAWQVSVPTNIAIGLIVSSVRR